MKKIERLSNERAAGLIGRCLVQWKNAFGLTGKPKPRASLRVFKPESVAKAMEMMNAVKEEKKAGGDRVLENALCNDGYRFVPDAKKAGLKLEAVKYNFENLVEPIGRLQTDLVLAGAMKPADFHITPILLLGDPGIGKTYLATQLAESLGVATEKISAGGAQGGFQFTGSHTSWQSARPGSIFTLLAEGKSASPVVVIDEVEKIRDGQYPVLPVLLDLLEPDTARKFKDEFFEMQFDASRIIFVLTANSLDGVPASLLSRVEVFDVPRPEPTQRLRIIQALEKQLRQKTKKQIELDKGASVMLSERMDIDLRKLTRLVKDAFAKAIGTGAMVAGLTMPTTEGRRPMGFL